MINKKFVQNLKEEYKKHEIERRRIISASNDILHSSKRAIFALHREEADQAGETLAAVEGSLIAMEKDFGFARLMQEGAYKAGVEEYVEAKMLFLVTSGQKVEAIDKIKIETDGYLGGICDLTGELVRRAINQAAAGHWEEAEKQKTVISDIMAELVEFDMTGYLRTKYDQAKTNLRKIEQIVYEIKLRK